MDAERVRALLRFDRRTGAFTWRVAPNGRVAAGTFAGTLTKAGYLRIKIDGQFVMAHRLAWWLLRGEWPGGQLDHKNGNKQDNRLSNLREATPAINSQNARTARKRKNGGSLLGASLVERNRKWRASILHHGRSLHLGLFSTEQEAHAAYVAAKRLLHAGCTL